MFQRLLTNKLSRSKPFCISGASGVGKTTLIRDFAGRFSNSIHLDLDTAVDRSIFDFDVSVSETLKAISFLKGKEIRGKGTLIVLDEIHKCQGAVRWAGRFIDEHASDHIDLVTGVSAGRRMRKQAEVMTVGNTTMAAPFLIATSSVLTSGLATLTHPESGLMNSYYLHPFSFEEFLMVMDDTSSLEAFREVPVPHYAYEKLLNYFHLYSLIGGMPEITVEYATSGHLTSLKNTYNKIEDRFIQSLEYVTAGVKSRDLTIEVLQNTYPYAATRISFNRFGNLDKGSREIGQAFNSLESAFFLQMIQPVSSAAFPLAPDKSKFPRLQLLDTGLVNYFSGIQKPLFQSHDMNAIFEGQIARQVVGQEILAAESQDAGNGVHLHFWVRNKAQSKAEVDFVIQYNDLLIPVIVRSGEPGRLRSLHQFIDVAPHPYAVRLSAGKLSVQQAQTIRGKRFYLLNLPYFLAGKIKDHLKGFIRLTDGP